MNNRIRATLLAASFTTPMVVGSSLYLTACSTMTTAGVQTAITDAGLVVSGVSADYNAFLQLYPTALTPTQQTQVALYLQEAADALKQLQTVAGSTPTTGIALQKVEMAMNGVLGVIANVLPKLPGVPPAITAGFEAATVLLPIIEVTINQLVPTYTAPPPALHYAAVKATPMSADAARLELQRWSK
jgi:hypothetical protein